GDPCDPNPFRNNLGGLCPFGNLCNIGTCMPWCDLGSTAQVQCPTGTSCSPIPNRPLGSTALGATDAIGVCAENCDPYVDDTQTGCEPLATDAGQPPLGCKLSGNGSDQNPSPGMCVALIENPIAVGQPCNPFGWLDPCVSGAQCEAVSAGSYVCRQLCDPTPSDGVDAPACPSGQSCVAFQCGQ